MYVLPYNDPKALEARVNEKTTAVILEFLQGEGGITSATQEFVDKIFELRSKHNFLVIADEIQAGTGRTGKLYCFEHYSVEPDVATMAKGIGGGLPLGAIVARESLANVWEKGNHGTTYGGNAVACAAGLVVLEELESGVMANVVETGDYLAKKLHDVKLEFPELVAEARGRGLMQGLLLTFDAAKLVEAMLERGVIANAASGYILRIVPPLIAGKTDVDEYVAALRECLSEFNV
jgi:acetylornithine/succinyldiaminopimelate/putrescine aminotransferase